MKKGIRILLSIVLLMGLVITNSPIKTQAKEESIKTEIETKINSEGFIVPVRIKIINKPQDIISIKYKIVTASDDYPHQRSRSDHKKMDEVISVNNKGKIKVLKTNGNENYGFAIIETKIKYKDTNGNKKIQKCYSLAYCTCVEYLWEDEYKNSWF